MSLKRDEILDYTLRLIKQKSYSTFSYDEIAKKMNISKAAIHYYFEKKDDLGQAVVEKLMSGIVKSYEQCKHEIENQNGHPWSFIETRLNTISQDEICPIISLQTDYENLSPTMKEKVSQLSTCEIEMMKNLVIEYTQDPNNISMVLPTLMSMKGLLQYRRIFGEEFFNKAFENIKSQFYSNIKFEEIR